MLLINLTILIDLTTLITLVIESLANTVNCQNFV